MEEEPIYSVTTERVYSKLPEVYRILDVKNDWHFKKYISSVTDQLNEIDLLQARLQYILPEDRFDYYESLDQFNTYVRPSELENEEFGYAPTEQTSDLLDARTSDIGWLAYIGQLAGADLTDLSTDDQKRFAVINNYLGFRAGSREALQEAIKNILTGTKYSRVYPQRDGLGGSIFHRGGQWDVLIVTRPEESPSSEEIIAKIVSEGAKPAGVILHQLLYIFTWEILEVLLTSWNKIELMLTWQALEDGPDPDLIPE